MSQPDTTASPIRIRVHRHLRAIFPTYLTIQNDHLDALDRALAAGDLPAIHRLGHTIRGGAGTYELPLAAALGGRLEAAAEAGDMAEAAALVASLRDFFARLDVTFTG